MLTDKRKKHYKQPYQRFLKRGQSLTSTTDVNQQISFENCASLQHLCWRDRVDGLRFPILTNFGARPLTRTAEHAGRKERETQNKQRYTTLEPMDCLQLHFKRQFPLELREILQSRMKVPTLCRGLQVTWLPRPLDSRDARVSQLLFTATREWTYGPHTHRVPASGGFVVLPKWKALQVKPSTFVFVHLF